jgi:dolichol-phosphate mannosyltransferase
MTINFLLNNVFTYRDKRLAGFSFLRGLAFFYVVCAIGAGANIALASFLFENGIPWWIAGLVGAVIGAVWNYSLSSSFVWSGKSGLAR